MTPEDQKAVLMHMLQALALLAVSIEKLPLPAEAPNALIAQLQGAIGVAKGNIAMAEQIINPIIVPTPGIIPSRRG